MLESKDFDFNWLGGQISADMKMGSGLKFGITAGMYGETILKTPTTFVVANETGEMLGNINAKAIGTLNHSAGYTDTPGFLYIVSMTSPDASHAIDQEIAYQEITLLGMKNLFLGADVGYELMINRVTPFIDFTIGMNNTTLEFAHEESASGWMLALQGKIGLGYQVNQTMNLYTSYALRHSSGTTSEISGYSYGIYNVPAALSPLSALETPALLTPYDPVTHVNTIHLLDPNLSFDSSKTVEVDGPFSSDFGTPTVDSPNTISVTGQAAWSVSAPSLVTVDIPMQYHYSNAEYKKSTSPAPESAIRNYAVKIANNYQSIFEIGVRYTL